MTRTGLALASGLVGWILGVALCIAANGGQLNPGWGDVWPDCERMGAMIHFQATNGSVMDQDADVVSVEVNPAFAASGRPLLGRLAGLPVVVGDYVPHDEVWFHTRGQGVAKLRVGR